MRSGEEECKQRQGAQTREWKVQVHRLGKEATGQRCCAVAGRQAALSTKGHTRIAGARTHTQRARGVAARLPPAPWSAQMQLVNVTDVQIKYAKYGSIR